ncbi:hypothetical protein B0H14DRAFT_2639294 [Mycena olivaceomarginata]|nr:hypothetical protein B0H14DRAFT_2639294 [Mycena olivaceomarginata]
MSHVSVQNMGEADNRHMLEVNMAMQMLAIEHDFKTTHVIAQYYATPTPDGELFSPHHSDQEGTLCDPQASRFSSPNPEFDLPCLAPPAKIQSPGNLSSLSASDTSSLGASDVSSAISGRINHPLVFHRFPAPTLKAIQISEKPKYFASAQSLEEPPLQHSPILQGHWQELEAASSALRVDSRVVPVEA